MRPAFDALVSARLELTENLGEYVLAHLVAETGTQLIAKLPEMPKQSVGSEMHFTADTARIHLFDRQSGKRKL